jgi:hypothetical protein
MNLDLEVSASNMEAFNDGAMQVFRDKLKIKDDVVFSLKRCVSSGSGEFCCGFRAEGIISEDISRYDRVCVNLGMVFWEGCRAGALINLFVSNKSYILEFTYVPVAEVVTFTVIGMRFNSEEFSYTPPDAFA